MKMLQNIEIAFRRRMTRRLHESHEKRRDSYIDLTRTLLRCALDNTDWEYQVDREDDCFYGPLVVDDTEVGTLMLKPQANYIHALSYVTDTPVACLKLTEALLFCNKWNNQTFFPKAYIEERSRILLGETIINLGEGDSEEFVRECILKVLFNSHAAFFKEVAKHDLLFDNMEWPAEKV